MMARVVDAAASDLSDLKIGDIRGMKQLRRVAELLSFLHDVGCDRDKAGNRELHFDDYVLLVLLYLFNPMINSMRLLQQVADLPEVRKRLREVGRDHFGPAFVQAGRGLGMSRHGMGRRQACPRRAQVSTIWGCEPGPYCYRLRRLSVSRRLTDSRHTESRGTTTGASASVPSRLPSPFFYCGLRSERGCRSAISNAGLSPDLRRREGGRDHFGTPLVHQACAIPL